MSVWLFYLFETKRRVISRPRIPPKPKVTISPLKIKNKRISPENQSDLLTERKFPDPCSKKNPDESTGFRVLYPFFIQYRVLAENLIKGYLGLKSIPEPAEWAVFEQIGVFF
jgi:hypothetical protein